MGPRGDPDGLPGLPALADTDHLRVGVIFGHGRLFTAELDLASVGPLVCHRVDLVSEVVPGSRHLERAVEIAEGVSAFVERCTPVFEGR